MTNNGRDLFIIGGQDENTFTNEVWKFDLGTYKYTLLSKKAFEAPSPSANLN